MVKFPPQNQSGSRSPCGDCALPKMPKSGAGSNGADGIRTVMTKADVSSRGPKGGLMPKSNTVGLPRRSSS